MSEKPNNNVGFYKLIVILKFVLIMAIFAVIAWAVYYKGASAWNWCIWFIASFIIGEANVDIDSED